ncbi:MAG: sodium:proton symporter [Pseudomonadota bacterium]
MTALQRVFFPLAFLGQHGTIAIAASLLVGMAVPFLAATLRPWLDEAILTLLTLAFLRIGFRALGSELKKPLPVLLATAVALIALPALGLGLGAAFGLNQSHPEIYLALFIALAVPPITAVPIFAGLLRLPGAVALAFLILAMAATPLTAWLHASVFFPAGSLPLDPSSIGLRLAGFLVGAAALAFAIQKVAGLPRLDKIRTHLDGINVLAMLVFAIAVMDGVGPAMVQRPGLVAILFVATFALALGQMLLMRLCLFFMEAQNAISVSLATGLRNMGLMVASLGMAIPETTWLWFAVGQFPIFFMPWLIEIARKRGLSKEPKTSVQDSEKIAR